jgi:hypothetical protein
MVLFSIKMASVASVCVIPQQLQASAYSSCNDRSWDSILNIYTYKGLSRGGRVVYESLQNYSTLSTCANGCMNDYFCSFFDYNCETGDCVFYEDNSNGGHGADTENGHISGMYKNRAKN